MKHIFLILVLLLPLRPSPAQAAPTCSVIQQAIATHKGPVEGATLLAAVGGTPSVATHTVQRGDTLSAIARRYGVSVQSLILANGIHNPNVIYSGQLLTIPVSGSRPSGTQALAAPLTALWADGQARQGEVLPLWIQAPAGTQVTALMPDRLGDQVVRFQPYCGLLWGLVAFDALWDAPGRYPLTLTATYDGRRSTSVVMLDLQGVRYWEGPPIRYPPDKQPLLEPEVLNSENQRLTALITSLPPSPAQWTDLFVRPTDTVVTGWFGARGIANGRYTGYHEGIDYRGPTGTPVVAAAPGTIIVAEPLTVRGNTVYVDHGAGVVTGYFHLSEIAVRTGDSIAAGQRLGAVGGTGLTTGPHLHWEIRVNGRWTNPYYWLERYYP